MQVIQSWDGDSQAPSVVQLCHPHCTSAFMFASWPNVASAAPAITFASPARKMNGKDYKKEAFPALSATLKVTLLLTFCRLHFGHMEMLQEKQGNRLGTGSIAPQSALSLRRTMTVTIGWPQANFDASYIYI